MRIKNVLLNSSLKVTPVLYMADGHEVDLSPVTLDPAGVASINLRTALADAGPAAAAHSSAYGMAGVKYQWGWSAVLATVQNIDEVGSITFHSSLGADAQAVHDPSSLKAAHTIKGLWWAPHSTVSGFLALVNTNKASVSAQVVFSDAKNQPFATRTIPIGGHATALLALEDILASVKNIDATGSVSISYSGAANSLLAYEGIEDRSAGYSASPRMTEINPDPSADPQPVTQVQLAAPGVMIGPPDPAMLFPAQTVFQPYAYLYNASNQRLNIDILIASIQGGAPAKLGTIALAAGATAQADIVGMMRRLRLQSSGGYANLVFAYQGEFGDLTVETGSMDQTRNYVFEVAAVPEVTTISHTLCYWMISGDNDSMISVWNYTDKPSDELLTLFFARGQYKFPVHLAPGETKVLSVKSMQREQAPDVDGHVIPISTTEGSALLSSDKGETEKMSVALSSASFNVRNATCGLNCTTCNGISEFTLNTNYLDLNIQEQVQLQGEETYNTGTVQSTTSGSWSSSAPSVATMGSTGITTGISVGKATDQLVIVNAPVYAGNVCTSSGAVICPQASQMGASAPVVIACPTSITLSKLDAIPISDAVPNQTGYGAMAEMQANPTSQNWSAAKIYESVTPVSTTCPSPIGNGTDPNNKDNGIAFSVGASAQATYDPSLLFVAKPNIFYDEHGEIANVDELGATITHPSTCQTVSRQVYTCNGGTVGNFTITKTFTHGTANNLPATIVTVAEQ